MPRRPRAGDDIGPEGGPRSTPNLPTPLDQPALDASPADADVLASRTRLISYIARQIAQDFLRDRRPSPRKGN